MYYVDYLFFFFSSRRRHTRFDCDWSSDVCSSDLSTPRGPSSCVGEPGALLTRSAMRSACARSAWTGAVFFGRIGDLFSRIKTDGDAVRGRGRSEAADAVQHASAGRLGGGRPRPPPAAPPLRLDGPLPRRALEAAGSGGARPGPRRRPPGLLGFPTAPGADVRPHS